MIEPLLLTTVSVTTFKAAQRLTNATGFFFERNNRLFLVTSRHVVFDLPSNHFPDRIELELHTNEHNMACATGFSILLYRNNKSIWLQATDSAGEIDIAMIEIDRTALPDTVVYHAFTTEHVLNAYDQVEVGSAILIVGFPLGFHDTLHHMPVVRQACIASSFGLRFQGHGFFLTDARTHRGISGAPVVMRRSKEATDTTNLPWMLLGIHSAHMEIGTRDLKLDEALGLNCSWYADVLLTLTEH